MKTKESEEIFDRGINYFRAGFYSSALNEFYQVKKIAPDYPNIDYIIEAAIKKNDEVAGQISNFIEENFDKEIQDLSEELTFENSSHLGPKIQTLLKQGKFNEALKELTENRSMSSVPAFLYIRSILFSGLFFISPYGFSSGG